MGKGQQQSDQRSQGVQAETIVLRWGDPITKQRQAELEELLRTWEETPRSKRIGPFDGVKLTGADIFWLAAKALVAESGGTLDIVDAQRNLTVDRGARDFRALSLNVLNLHLEGANLRAAELGQARLNQAHLEYANLREAHLEGSSLYRVSLARADLHGAHLQRATLWGAQLESADLTHAQLDGASLREAGLTSAMLLGAHLARADLSNTRLVRTRFYESVLDRADLQSSHIDGADFRRASLGGTNFKRARLVQVNFGEAQLNRVNFRDSTIEGIRLNDACLEQIDLTGADLHDTNMRHAQLKDVQLCGAHLQGAQLCQAQLENVNLSGAHLEQTDLSLTRLTCVDLRRASLDSQTNLTGVKLSAVQAEQITVADTLWNGTNLAVVDWDVVALVGDERDAWSWKFSRELRARCTGLLSARTERQVIARRLRQERLDQLERVRDALRANRQLAMALRSQGLNEEADHFTYRAHQLQRRIYRLQSRRLRWLLSSFMGSLAGYGFRPERSVIWYVTSIMVFALLYARLAHLNLQEAVVLSVTSFHGRGFPGTLSLADPIMAIAALEAIFGLLIEVSFIATFTQRFLGGK